jgi:predicted porin
MQKKVMALAVAGALSAPAAAFAQASNVQIYGRVNVGVDNYEAKGAAAGSGSDFKGRIRVFDQGSRLGVRGTEDLGGGLKAIFQIESGVNVDSGNSLTQSGSANASAGTFATRDSFAGLEGGFGRITLGRQNAWYSNGVIEQTNANYVNAGLPFFSGNLGVINGATARTSNLVLYTTPTFGGFNASVYYAPNSETAAANTSTNASIYGWTARYSGVVNAQVDWGINKKATPLAGAGDLSAIKVGVGWPYAPGAQISVVVIEDKQESSAGSGFAVAGDTIKQRGIGVNWEHVFGNIQALAQAFKVQKAKGCTETATVSCDNTETQGFMAGAKYLLSKRTGVYVTYAKVTNKDRANLDFTPSGYTAISGTAPAGIDPRVWALGIMHNF